ncbi:hypothetical protein OH77DRAFT_1525577 [Trametes cingulata]|nr:hypothetical protein OH77DRAFT_1525577 [Trametes cingulata]
MEPLCQQPAVDLSSSGVQDGWQDHPMCYEYYLQMPCEDLGMVFGDASGHTASMDGELQYPYYPTLLHFEEELSNNYLSAQLPFAPCEPDAYDVSSAAPTFLEVTTYEASTMDEDAQTDFAYARWWHKTPMGRAFKAELRAKAQVYRPPREVPTYPAVPPSIPATCDPSALTSNAVVYTSTFSIVASGSQGSSYSEAAAYSSTSAGHVESAPGHTDSTTAAMSTSEPSAVAHHPVRISPRLRDHSSLSKPSRKSAASSSRNPPSKKLIASSRRNTAVTPSTRATPRTNRWKCPYCPYVQRNKRSPDLKRHVGTHTRPTDDAEALWVCCGVPLIDATEHGVPEKLLLEEPFEYEGMFMVGGCRKTFSRRDALTRHLRKYAGECFGDALAPYLPGNRIGAR